MYTYVYHITIYTVNLQGSSWRNKIWFLLFEIMQGTDLFWPIPMKYGDI